MESRKGFLATLFDFSFSDFITSRLIRFLYGLALIAWGFSMVVMVGTGFTLGIELGLLYLMAAPLLFVLGAIGIRIYLELIVVIFHMAEHLKRLVELAERRNAAPPPEPLL
ncbi:DUF4282 domain-containing protein [Rhodothermus profundi]|uniref:DUF4282 domain-containing protein n=1 Tax=Rhodothermus profundi TaxID=633813 RepID=A0A1M6UQL2_9BACT|nr:DUF4282 domain-containing protein [Rhodothermus profundi]SHK71453.1 protein of unknown function [Rhodothermus profundi]